MNLFQFVQIISTGICSSYCVSHLHCFQSYSFQQINEALILFYRFVNIASDAGRVCR